MTDRPDLVRRYPDFLCVGAQKAGTTWLDANLRRHPRVWMPWIKELQYFNDVHIPAHRAWTGGHRLSHGARAQARVRRWAEATGAGPGAADRIQALWSEPVSDDWYGRVFAHAREDQVCGEVTPDYSLLPPEGIAHVHRVNPRMKIILLMRDPVERCWSHLRMLGRRGDAPDVAQPVHPDVLARANYGAIAARWQGAFGRDAVFTAWIEDAAGDPRGFFAAVLDFLGLPWSERVVARAAAAVFVGPALDMPPVLRAALEAGCRAADPVAPPSWPCAGAVQRAGSLPCPALPPFSHPRGAG